MRKIDTVDSDGNPIQFVDSNNDLYVWLWKDNTPSKYYVKMLVAEAFVPNPNNYTNVGFIDKDNTNCRADNLYWY